MNSKPCFAPNSRSFMSASLKNGIESVTPGTLIPLWFETLPPWTTSHTISVSCTSRHTISITPSLIRMRLPGRTSFGRFGKVMAPTSFVQGTSRVVRVKVAPVSSISEPFTKFFRRISGPLVSSMVATGSPNSSRTRRTCSRRAVWSA